MADTPRTPRRPPRTPETKLDDILKEIQQAGWSLSQFLAILFRTQDETNTRIERSSRHEQMVMAALNGRAQPHFGTILEHVFQASCQVRPIPGDNQAPAGSFIPHLPINEILHAESAIVTWAVNKTTALVREEAKVMSARDTGLQMRARAPPTDSQRTHALPVSWQALNNFSFHAMQKLAEVNAPVAWHIISSYANTDFQHSKLYAVRQRRPQNLGSIDVILSLTFIRTWFASMYPLCRGVYLFATKASRTLLRVESRLGHSVAYDTVYAALQTMAHQRQRELKEALRPDSGQHFIVVGDNIQAYAKPGDARYGRQNHMIKGFAGTAIEMEDFDPMAFDVNKLIARQQLLERRKLTVDDLINDIDFSHLDNITSFHFLRTLVEHVPTLAAYTSDLDTFEKGLMKNQINPTRKSNIIPLATSSADEAMIQGMHEAVKDILHTQMGLTEESLQHRAVVFSGDGKTFEQLHRLKRYLVMQTGHLESLRCLIPLLELWHTKWTELSRIVRRYWGKANDPSSLGYLAGTADCPTPSDLRKVDFSQGAHLVELVLKAQILNCWENFFSTDNLEEYFYSLQVQNQLPSFQSLLQTSNLLGQRHATTAAYEKARHLHHRSNSTTEIPLGDPWPRTASDSDSLDSSSDSESHSSMDRLSDLDEPAVGHHQSDHTHANAILFIRDALRWQEVCRAIALGDTGRVWEILKVWIFTFCGGGNPNYTNYLLEVYCSFELEFPPELRKAILNNWLVNPHGVEGQFIEMDLLQEHSNFWLEEMAQHKGKEFDDPFYRWVISMHVIFFLRLKDEMEQAVSLHGRTKSHGSPKLVNELRSLMHTLRIHQVNKCRPGRQTSPIIEDDFAKGIQVLQNGKLQTFLTRSTLHMDILASHNTQLSSMEEDSTEIDLDAVPERGEHQPPLAPFVLNGNHLQQNPVDDYLADPM